MSEKISVSITGPALSFLLYENVKDVDTYQEGFLVGEIEEKRTKTITDQDQEQVNITKTVHISCAIPAPPVPHYFHDSSGRVDTAKVKQFLGDVFPHVVAWYKYKRENSFFLTMKESAVHLQLQELFQVPPELFTCCVLISDSSTNNSTHSYNQTYMRYFNRKYDELPMHVVNLGDALDAPTGPDSETFNRIVGALELTTGKGLDAITRIYNAVRKYTNSLVDDLAAAEAKLFQLEQELRSGDQQLCEVSCSGDADKRQEKKRVTRASSSKETKVSKCKDNKALIEQVDECPAKEVDDKSRKAKGPALRSSSKATRKRGSQT